MSVPSEAFVRRQPPLADRVVLAVAPELASWDRAGSWSQLRLERFLTHLEERLRALPWPEGPVAVQLDVALPPGVSPLVDRDLDNYRMPVVAKLARHDQIVSVWGRKSLAEDPRFSVSTAVMAEPGTARGDGFVSVRPSGSASSSAWKHDLHEQVKATAAAARPGALAMEIAFRVGSGRRWHNLWKRTIDALGPSVGIPDPSKPFSPYDGRIVELGMHRTVDPALGHDVEIGAWWRAAEVSR